MCLLSLCLAVLPVCAHSQNVKLRISMCFALACRKSHFRLWVTRGFQWYMCGLMLLTLFAWVVWNSFAPDQTNSRFPFSCLPPTPWQQNFGIGEALNPGPEVAVGTLNVISLPKYSDMVALEYPCPLALVLTETCLTKESLPIVLEKSRKAQRNLVTSCLSKPRQSACRKDSVFRGQSGGSALASDLPCRRSSLQMPLETWLSTRLVEGLISISTQLMARVVGIYGHSGCYESCNITDGLLGSVLDHILASTLPCFVLGDFNCSLEELGVWTTLSSLAWKDANSLARDLFGTPLLPTWKGQTRIDFI